MRPKVWTPETREAFTRLRTEGLSITQAAAMLGVSRGSACWASARYGILREPADLSRARGRKDDRWSEERLTEKWRRK